MSDTPDRDQPADEAAADHEDGDDAVTASELLRSALVDDEDPRFPRWLPLPGIVAALGWAGYDWAAADGAFLATLVWPGAAILVLATVATWLGWQLDID